MTSNRSKTLRTAAALALAVSAAALSLSCNKQEGEAGHGATPAAAMPERPPAPVSVAQAITRDVPVYLDEIGRTVAVETVSIIPQVGGKVIATHVNDGDYVKKGQL